MVINIRAAVADDADSMGLVHMACWREAYGQLLTPAFFDEHPPEQSADRWQRYFEKLRGGTRVFVAESDDAVEVTAVPTNSDAALTSRIVGFAMSGPAQGLHPPRDLELYSIYVLAREYGTGVGQSLLDAVLEQQPASLWVAKDNPRATAFYRRNGFELDGTRDTVPFMENLVELRMVR